MCLSRLSVIPPLAGSAPPVNPEPAPLGTITILCSLQYFKISDISCSCLGKTTASGSNLSLLHHNNMQLNVLCHIFFTNN